MPFEEVDDIPGEVGQSDGRACEAEEDDEMELIADRLKDVRELSVGVEESSVQHCGASFFDRSDPKNSNRKHRTSSSANENHKRHHSSFRLHWNCHEQNSCRIPNKRIRQRQRTARVLLNILRWTQALRRSKQKIEAPISSSPFISSLTSHSSHSSHYQLSIHLSSS
ncbi:hypothetical protein KEM48_008870 [Puccinia striiformis f. sp. tritici PST-130]|nr:hypothetical protein KEM48_008870 [Puccinia striiformis f. sp. tritici PST-130]